MTPSTRTEGSYDALDILLLVWRAVMILLAIVIGAYGYWTATAAGSAKCAGMQWIAGYRGGALALWGMSLLAVGAVAWMLIRYRRTKITETLSIPRYRETIFSFGAVRITMGMLLVYGAIIGSPILLAKQAEFLMTRYPKIASYCRTEAAANRSGKGDVAGDDILNRSASARE